MDYHAVLRKERGSLSRSDEEEERGSIRKMGLAKLSGARRWNFSKIFTRCIASIQRVR